MSKRNWRWLARDHDQLNYVSVWDSKEPPICNDGYFIGNNPDKQECRNLYLAEVKFLFGFVPRKGQCFKVVFSKGEVK